MKTILLLFLVVCFSFQSTAQKIKIDSGMRLIMPKTTTEEERIEMERNGIVSFNTAKLQAIPSASIVIISPDQIYFYRNKELNKGKTYPFHSKELASRLASTKTPVLIKPGLSATYASVLDCIKKLNSLNLKEFALLDLNKTEKIKFNKPVAYKAKVVIPTQVFLPSPKNNETVFIFEFINNDSLQLKSLNGEDSIVRIINPIDQWNTAVEIENFIVHHTKSYSGVRLYVRQFYIIGKPDLAFNRINILIEALKANDQYKYTFFIKS